VNRTTSRGGSADFPQEVAMIDWTSGWQVAAVLGGAVLLVGVGTLLFQAGCALADVTGPRFVKALLVFGLALAVCAPLAILLVRFAGRYDDPDSPPLSPARGLALAGALLGTWVVSALVYAVALATPYRKGLVIAGTELLLAALLAALLGGVLMVALAGAQILHQPPRAAGFGRPGAAVARALPP
jgi:hypothetical protein